jgi:hypothetical protein
MLSSTAEQAAKTNLVILLSQKITSERWGGLPAGPEATRTFRAFAMPGQALMPGYYGFALENL